MNNKYKIFLITLCTIFTLLSCYPNNDSDIKKLDFDKKIKVIKKESYNDKFIYVGFDLRWEPVDDINLYLPFIKYLEKETGLKFRFKVPVSYLENIYLLGIGKIKISFMGSVSCMIAHEKFGAYPIAVGLNTYNKPYYQSVIIKNKYIKDIKTIKDLRGKRFSFGNQYSTQGYLIPRKMLEENGINLEDIKYDFSSSHFEVANKVINGFSDAGAIQDKLAFILNKEGKVDIVEISKPYPSSTICVSKILPLENVKIIKEKVLKFNPEKDIDFKNSDWKLTEMSNGFIDANLVDFSEIMKLIKKYDLIK